MPTFSENFRGLASLAPKHEESRLRALADQNAQRAAAAQRLHIYFIGRFREAAQGIEPVRFNASLVTTRDEPAPADSHIQALLWNVTKPQRSLLVRFSSGDKLSVVWRVGPFDTGSQHRGLHWSDVDVMKTTEAQVDALIYSIARQDLWDDNKVPPIKLELLAEQGRSYWRADPQL